MDIDPIQSGPDVEQIIADWIFNKFGVPVRVRRGTIHYPILVWEHFIIVSFCSANRVESGSWCHPKDLHQIAIGDPELFEKLEALIKIRFGEISKDYGYAGMLARTSTPVPDLLRKYDSNT